MFMPCIPVPARSSARVQGDAFGGGVGLAAACEIAGAAEAAHFALSEVKLGIVAATISPHLVRAMGARQAARYMLTGEKFTASQARTLGLVHEVTLMEGLDREVERIAHHLLAASPAALAATSACSPTWSKPPWTMCCWPPPRSVSPMHACRPKGAKVSPRFPRKERLPGRRRSSSRVRQAADSEPGRDRLPCRAHRSGDWVSAPSRCTPTPTRSAAHVAACDEAVHIGGPRPQESYLRGDAILEAAKRTGADAIHPGYGFLSENAEFAAACARVGIKFVGPTPEAIEAMGSKSAAKALMEKAGVPLTPGYHGDRQEPDYLLKQARRIGFPVLIKAVAGGGGKGMRRVDHAADFAAALASCQREAAASFKDDRVLVEKYLTTARHIEIQVFGDNHGNAVYLFERDCSVQRRHQKVIEEAPAPGMTPERRRQMGEAAVAAARAVDYRGAGTVEFIVDPRGRSTSWR